jgi:hypothetical protein
MDLRKILVESFQLLTAKPKAFVPRLITTAIYSVFILYAMSLLSDMVNLNSFLNVSTQPSMENQQALAQITTKAGILLLFMPFLYLIDIFSYAMYPRIVADYRASRQINLGSAIKDGLRAWKVVFAMGFVVFAFLMVVSLIAFVSMVLTEVTGNPLFIAFSVVLALALVLFFAIVVFFVVPSAVLNEKGLMGSFRESLKLGFENRWDLLKLNLLFLVLVLATMALAYFVKTDPTLSIASIALFLLLRIAEAVVYTYMSVTNPVAYLQVKVNNPPNP